MERDINGQWSISQSTGHELVFDIVQDSDGSLHGSGRVLGGREANGSGQLTGNAFLFTVDWNNNGRGGQYSGTFDGQGRLSGVTFDIDHPGSQATWFAHAFEHT